MREARIEICKQLRHSAQGMADTVGEVELPRLFWMYYGDVEKQLEALRREFEREQREKQS